MKHELPDLPFSETSLSPYISAETLHYHHGKHHAKYVTTLNELIACTEMEHWSLEEIIRKATGKIFNNAAQVWNHTFYWNCLSPDGGGAPEGQLAETIDHQFGSYDNFKQAFTESAVSLFGSGWVWLVKAADGELTIQQGSNAETPIRKGGTPILTCDVWEHAYYIDYRNDRPKYVDAFWNLVNWEFASLEFQGLAHAHKEM